MIYQVDCSVLSSGKKVSMTKRRIRWRFGIANQEAIKAGKSGVECRGYEHEITLVWSITSGKKQIIDDGEEAYHAIGRRAEGKFQHSWRSADGANRIYTIVAHAAVPLRADKKIGFRQFELLVDGRSFESFPRIFELGQLHDQQQQQHHGDQIPVTSPRFEYRTDSDTSTRGYQLNHYEYQGQGKNQLPHQNQRQRSSSPVSNTVHTPDLLVEKASTEPQAQELPSTGSLLDMDYPSSTPSLESASFWDSGHSGDSFPSQSHDSFGQVPSQPPSYETVWSSIMDAYDTNENDNDDDDDVHGTSPAFTNATTTTQGHYDNNTNLPNISKLTIDSDLPFDATETKKNGNDASSLESPRDVLDFDGGVFQNLVNLDDITNSSKWKAYTPQDANVKRSSSTLSDLKSRGNGKGEGMTKTTTEKKEVMKTHQEYYQNHPSNNGAPNALVVYGHGHGSGHGQRMNQHQSYNNYNCAFMYNAPMYG